MHNPCYKHRAGLLTTLFLKAMLIWDILTRHSTVIGYKECRWSIIQESSENKDSCPSVWVVCSATGLSAASKMDGLTCKGRHCQQSLIYEKRVSLERGVWKASFHIWLQGRELLYNQKLLEGFFLFFFCTLVFHTHQWTCGQDQGTPSDTLLPVSIALQSAKISFQGSNQIK